MEADEEYKKRITRQLHSLLLWSGTITKNTKTRISNSFVELCNIAVRNMNSKSKAETLNGSCGKRMLETLLQSDTVRPQKN